MCEWKIDISIPLELEGGRMAEFKMQQPVAEAGVDLLKQLLVAEAGATVDMLDRLEARRRQQEGYKIYT